ncbi:hypothetical protein Patl1_04155 [Pistacia atlantica]|uniref:Uncharacterized protein n=1 Tax=Pistacia atlantica TaxID=434234 RepID=A0ACC1BT21_9ROSI|nr:hypothetical protein Patl1_04155 [Pistacia atlantica]
MNSSKVGCVPNQRLSASAMRSPRFTMDLLRLPFCPNGEEYAWLVVGEKVDKLELMSLQKQLKSWEPERYY